MFYVRASLLFLLQYHALLHIMKQCFYCGGHHADLQERRYVGADHPPLPAGGGLQRSGPLRHPQPSCSASTSTSTKYQMPLNRGCGWCSSVPSPHLQPVPARPRTILIIWVTQQFQTKQSPAGAGGRSADPAI